jgi:hypothetical protein
MRILNLLFSPLPPTLQISPISFGDRKEKIGMKNEIYL